MSAPAPAQPARPKWFESVADKPVGYALSGVSSRTHIVAIIPTDTHRLTQRTLCGSVPDVAISLPALAHATRKQIEKWWNSKVSTKLTPQRGRSPVYPGGINAPRLCKQCTIHHEERDNA